jgi:multidrug efflux pump subunit AcrA (membrane-fusion protein)
MLFESDGSEMISTETKEQEVQSTSTKVRASLPKPNGTPTTPRPRVGRLNWAWLLLLVVVLASAAVWLLLPPSVQVTKLTTMTVTNEAVGIGYVQAKVPVSASAKINGIIRKVYVDQGDPVKKGQVLAQLENEDYRSQVTQAESQVQAAQAASPPLAQSAWRLKRARKRAKAL